jgi:hypothetical protein
MREIDLLSDDLNFLIFMDVPLAHLFTGQSSKFTVHSLLISDF